VITCLPKIFTWIVPDSCGIFLSREGLTHCYLDIQSFNDTKVEGSFCACFDNTDTVIMLGEILDIIKGNNATRDEGNKDDV
jgi:hypothetical protein